MQSNLEIIIFLMNYFYFLQLSSFANINYVVFYDLEGKTNTSRYNHDYGNTTNFLRLFRFLNLI